MIINLSGKKFAGKDFVANYITNTVTSHYVYNFKWADALKDDLIRMLDVVGVSVGRDAFDNNAHPMKTRLTPLMQAYGTDFWRSIDPDYWVKVGMNRLEGILNSKTSRPQLIVITDTRFPNEVEGPKRIPGKTINVRLSVTPEKQDERSLRLKLPTLTVEKRNHPSETALDSYANWDLVIDSDRTIEDVYVDFRQLLVNNGVTLKDLV